MVNESDDKNCSNLNESEYFVRFGYSSDGHVESYGPYKASSLEDAKRIADQEADRRSREDGSKIFASKPIQYDQQTIKRNIYYAVDHMQQVIYDLGFLLDSSDDVDVNGDIKKYMDFLNDVKQVFNKHEFITKQANQKWDDESRDKNLYPMKKMDTI